jgi:putative DNA primase/helicase
MLFKNLDFRNAAMQIEQAAGFVKSVKYEDKKSDEETRKRLNKLWAGSIPVVAGDPVMEYLEHRGINLSFIPVSLRYHPELMYYREGEDRAISVGAFDAMLAMVSAPDGSGVTIHRTWLKDGEKAPVATPRKLAQGLPMKGAAIRLSPVGEVLGVAEGLETALAAMQKTGIPTWACVSAGGLESFIPPKEVKRVVIFGDNDESFTGQAAAYKLAKSLVMAGLSVEVRIPEKSGTDWADQ